MDKEDDDGAPYVELYDENQVSNAKSIWSPIKALNFKPSKQTKGKKSKWIGRPVTASSKKPAVSNLRRLTTNTNSKGLKSSQIWGLSSNTK